ncbi:KTSC domain-containing protein [Longitalea arenae]|uniref:KTSC domain-containing protein n=1 Tax=Longitalea arenae TaxID=2812558 RepID=UPI00196898BE|nr:KTSC domain-containing protein [Longitalea arenae]
MPSSVVAHIDYDPKSLILRITYTSGQVYDYLHVPASIYEAMKKSGSKGIYLNKFIKGHYPFKKLT